MHFWGDFLCVVRGIGQKAGREQLLLHVFEASSDVIWMLGLHVYSDYL